MKNIKLKDLKIKKQELYKIRWLGYKGKKQNLKIVACVTCKDHCYYYDENNNITYYENITGYWYKSEYDKNNNEIYFEDSTGYWYEYNYDNNNNEIYYENSTGHWNKSEYDKNNNEIYFEDNIGLWRKY